ncbi:MAG: CocE/NonD family hydrolase [Chloroflexota bacterium]
MKKRTLFTLLGLGWAGWELFRHRWQWGSRLLGLPKPHYQVDRQTPLSIPMPDGINLIADHYFPQAQGEFPTLLIRTPYDRGEITALFGRFFAGQGYHVVVQDTRGRFGSEGEFVPFRHEAADGKATIAWLVQQPWCNGVVGMFGQSYLGYVQWAAAGRKPPGLRAIVPIVTESRLAPVAEEGLALDNWLRWLLVLSVDDLVKAGKPFWQRLRLLMDTSYQNRLLEPGHWHLPVGEADTAVLGQPISFFRDWLAHPQRDDPYYQDIDHSHRVGEIEAEAHLIAGWHDIFLERQLVDYARLRAAGKRPYLTIGPWTHMDLVGMIEALRQGLIWFDSQLKQKRGRLRTQPVRVYIMGSDEWRELDDWPPPTTDTPYYLHPAGSLATQAPPAEAPPDQYRYNPADPTPSLGGPLLTATGAGAQDQRPLLNRGDCLFYQTDPLLTSLTLMGSIKLALYVESNQPSTDFFGRLCDVHPDGRVLNICEGLFRLRDKDLTGLDQPPIVIPTNSQNLSGLVHALEIDMWATAYCFRPGHRLALIVTSAAFPRVARNLNTGEPHLSGRRLLVATQTVYHDAARPSALLLPVVGA